MQRLDIFKSEGGFRLAGAVHNNGPVMDYSPWFATNEEAEQAKANMIAKEEQEILIEQLVKNREFSKLEALIQGGK